MTALQFEISFTGKVVPHDAMGEQMGIEAEGRAESAAFPALADGTSFEATVENQPDGSFTLRCRMTSRDGVIEYGSPTPSDLSETDDPAKQAASVTCSITSGSGCFNQVSGSVILTFTVDENGGYADAQVFDLTVS